MTILEFAQHVLPATRIRDIEESAQVADVQELCLILTQAVAEFFALAPAIHRRTTVSRALGGPEKIEVTLQNGSPFVDGAPFNPSWRGRSIHFAQQGDWNEIVAPDRLLHVWTGPSGTFPATVYADAVAIDDMLIERICTHPEVHTAGGAIIQLLPREGYASERFPFEPRAMAVEHGPIRTRDFAQAPSEYWPQYVGQSIAVDFDAVFQIRVIPIPTLPWKIQFDAEIAPLSIRIPDLTAAKSLPVPDGIAHRVLIPMARGRAADSPIASESANLAALRAAAAEARAQAYLQPTTFVASHLTMGTPDGW